MRSSSFVKKVFSYTLILNLLIVYHSEAASKGTNFEILHQRISKSSSYLKLSSCALEDMNNRISRSNVNANIVSYLDPNKTIRVLIYPIDFSDLTSSIEIEPNFDKLENDISHYYQTVSHGKMIFKWERAEGYERMPKSILEYDAGVRADAARGAQMIKDAQDLAFIKYNRADFDYFIAAPPPRTRISQISTSISFLQVDQRYLSATILAGDYWESNKSWTLPAHEIGHALGLVDLYSLAAAAKISENFSSYFSQFKYMGYFDLMNWPNGPAPELTAWNRWILGFLLPDEVRCLPFWHTLTLLSPLAKQEKGVKALFLKFENSKLLVVENRIGIGFDQKLPKCAAGVVVYIVDVSKISGAGQLSLVMKSKIKKNFIFGQPLHKGEKLKVGGYLIENLDLYKGKAVVRVSNSN